MIATNGTRVAAASQHDPFICDDTHRPWGRGERGEGQYGVVLRGGWSGTESIISAIQPADVVVPRRMDPIEQTG